MNEPKISPELLEQAERVFGDKETATAWFYRPDANLLGRRPLDAIEAGDEAIVAMILDRLEPPERTPTRDAPAQKRQLEAGFALWKSEALSRKDWLPIVLGNDDERLRPACPVEPPNPAGARR
jgi:hypothetical protein